MKDDMKNDELMIDNDLDLEDEKKKTNKTFIGSKIFMFILIIGYFSYFIYFYVTSDFNWNDKLNIFKVVLLIITVFILCITALTNNTVALFFSIINYILIFCLIGISATKYINIDLSKDVKQKVKSESKKEVKPQKEKIVCMGKTDISDNTEIDIDYTDDKTNLLVYRYHFDLDKQQDAEKIVNEFNKEYSNIESIYGEININDSVTVALTYDIDNIKKEELPNLKDNKFLSYKELQASDLNNLQCKTRS